MSLAIVLTELMPVCARGTAAAPCSASLFLLTITSPCHWELSVQFVSTNNGGGLLRGP